MHGIRFYKILKLFKIEENFNFEILKLIKILLEIKLKKLIMFKIKCKFKNKLPESEIINGCTTVSHKEISLSLEKYKN